MYGGEYVAVRKLDAEEYAYASSRTVTPWKSNSAVVPSVLSAALNDCASFDVSVSVSLKNSMSSPGESRLETRKAGAGGRLS